MKHYALGRLPVGEMNKTEGRYSDYLTLLKASGEILWFRFEGIKLRLAANTFLTVDFAVMAADGVMEMHEVKGALAMFADDSKAKVKIAAEAYPFRFKVVIPRAKKDGGGWDITEVGR